MRIPKSLIIALIGLVAALIYVYRGMQTPPRPEPIRPPALKPFEDAVVGTGLIEAVYENVSVTPFRNGKVATVAVREGQTVATGDVLYTLDAAEIRSRLNTLRRNVATQQALLARQQAEPRPEDLPPLQAAVDQAQAQLSDAQAQLTRLRSAGDAVSRDQITRQQFTVAAAQAQLTRAQADLQRQQAGAWQFDLRQTQAQIEGLQAQAGELEVLVAQSTVRAPQPGVVLKTTIRPGETVTTTPTDPPVLLGRTDTLQVRVDIDEVNASRVTPNMDAIAVVRGNSKMQFPLKFHHVIPYMVPKQNLTGRNTERVDVRVLQMIYHFEPPPFPVYVGQQVDVFLKPKKPSAPSTRPQKGKAVITGE
jgi:HlyD family secretion protein